MITGRIVREGRVLDEPVRSSDAFRRAAAEDHEFAWFDVEEPTEEELAELGRDLHLHPLAVENALDRGQRSRVDLFEEHVSVVLRPLTTDGSGRSKGSEVHVFASPAYLVTLRFSPAFDLAPVTRRWTAQPDLAGSGTGFALYALLDVVVDGYLDEVDRLEEEADALEDHVFEPAVETVARPEQERLLALRRSVVRLRRTAIPLRQGIEMLFVVPGLVRSELQPYYRDVTDHLFRVAELCDGIRDLLTSVLEVRAALAANRLNEVMKKLTAWAGIVLVPTLIAGVYGMNFRDMPELTWSFGYPLALGLMGGSSLALYVVFKRKGWL